MAATITGVVFNDLNHNGVRDVGELGIANIPVVIRNPAGACTTVTTDGSGVYTFTNLTTVGNYTVYETAVDPGATCPPTNFVQPTGYTNSTTFRTETINVTQAHIDNGNSIAGRNYGHDNPVLFKCKPIGYQVAQQGGGNSEFVSIDIVTGIVTPIKADIGLILNGMGYHVSENVIYGMQRLTNNLVRLAADGTTTNYGAVNGLPAGAYVVGDVDTNGLLYLYASSNMYVVDVNQNSPDFGKMLATRPTSTALAIGDWSFNPIDQQLYTVTGNGVVERVDPATGTVTPLTTIGIPTSLTIYGATFMDASGTFYTIRNTDGSIYRIQISGSTAIGELFSTSLQADLNDGAMCVNAVLEVDFGDAPDTALGTGTGNYNTTLASNGPRHGLINQLFLGTTVTGEYNAWQNSTATGDDIRKGIQDDGVTFPLPELKMTDTAYALPLKVTNNTLLPANLYVWVDFNQDGIFSGREAATSITIPALSGTTDVVANFTITPPSVPGTSFIRARITTQNLENTNSANLNLEDTRSIGPAQDGEVEDYLINIVATNLVIKKTTNPQIAIPGQLLTYIITIKNNGPSDAQLVELIDVLDKCIVNPEFSVNGGEWKKWSGGPSSLGTITAGAVVTVQIKGMIDPDCSEDITNTATVTSPTPDPVPNTRTTTITTQLDKVSITKTADKEVAMFNDELTYAIQIRNNGTQPISNVVLTDPMPQCATFVAGSVVFNGRSLSAAHPANGIALGTLNPGEAFLVSFTIRIAQACCPAGIANRATVTYEYVIGVPPNQQRVPFQHQSNTLVTPIAAHTFKQLSKDEVVEIPAHKPAAEEIMNTLVDVQIMHTKLIQTIIGTSYEGQKLTGYKLVIEGRLNQKIEYIALEPQQSVHSAHFSVPFSTYIILPAEFTPDTPVEVEAFIEDIYTKLIDCRRVFKNVTFRLLVKYGLN